MADLTCGDSGVVDGGGGNVQLPRENRKYEIVSCAGSLGLFMILKVVLTLYLTGGGRQQRTRATLAPGVKTLQWSDKKTKPHWSTEGKRIQMLFHSVLISLIRLSWKPRRPR